MSELLNWQEKEYLYKTINYNFPLVIQTTNLSGTTRKTFSDDLGGRETPVSNYAPLSFQGIILFYALDKLYIRLEESLGKSYDSSTDFKKRLNALPMNNDTQIIFKFCYAIMREIRNKLMHDNPSEDNQELTTNDFVISRETINILFGLVVYYIKMFNGNELNKYDIEVLKQLTKLIFNGIKFSNTQSGNKFSKNINNVFSKLKYDDTFRSYYRLRFILKLETLSDIKKIQRQSIPNPYNNEELNTEDEYLIVIEDDKYLIFGSHLDDCIQENNLSEWKLTGNWIGETEYIKNYASN